MTPTDPGVLCLECRQPQPLYRFRVFSQAPLRFYDFCADCEAAHGVLTLYNKHGRATTTVVRQAVMKQDDPVNREIQYQANDKKLELQREIAVRELSQRRLLFFIKRLFPEYTPGWVHNDICRRLEKFLKDVEDKKSPRLMLNVPPRHGKSAIASDYFPSWALGHHPDWDIITTSFALELASDFSKNVRERIKSNRTYQAIFPNTKLAFGSEAVTAWRTTAGGNYVAAGAGGPILGKGAHIFIIDDPHKNDEEANSPTMREKIHRWYSSTAASRLHPGGGMLIIQQRWHDDDLTGHQLTIQRELREQGVPEEEIDQWEVVTYPAIAEHDEYLDTGGNIVHDPEDPTGMRLLRRKGEALHPQRYTLNMLMRKKNTSTKEEWNALYQQNPVPDDGDFFTRSDLRFVPSLPGKPSDYTYFSAWDLAITEKQASDWTVGVVGALSAEADLYIVDMVRFRSGDPRRICEAAKHFARRYPLFVFGMEDTQIKKTLWPLMLDALRKERMHIGIDENLKPVTDKLVRANPLRALTQHGQLYFVDQPFAQKAVDEMLRFPKGTHDDIVDALAWLARMSKSVPLPQVRGTKGTKRKSWKDKLRAGGNRSGPGSYMTA